MKDHSLDVERALEEIAGGNYSTAFNLLLPLAESGNPAAMCNLAILYQSGWGVAVDGRKAVELYANVGKMNLREDCVSGIAYHNLATIYRAAVPGVARDLVKAEKYESLARELGFEM